MKNSYLLLTVIVLIITPINCVYGGWIVYENNLILGTTTIVKIQDDMMISETENEVNIYDMRSGTITMYYKEPKVYWSGSVDEYRKGMVASLQEFLKMVNGEMAVYVKDMILSSKQPLTLEFANNDNINFIKTSAVSKIGGLSSVKYDIFINGRIYKNVWVTETITPFKNTDVKTCITWDRVMSPSIGNDYFYEDTQDFVDILKRGYITKITNVEAGNMTELVVERVEITTIPEEAFMLPEGYTFISIEKLLFESMKTAIN